MDVLEVLDKQAGKLAVVLAFPLGFEAATELVVGEELLVVGRVGEPLAAWLRDRWAPGSGVDFHYDVFGTTRDDMRVVRSPS